MQKVTLPNQTDALALGFSANSLLLSAPFSHTGNVLKQFKTICQTLNQLKLLLV